MSTLPAGSRYIAIALTGLLCTAMYAGCGDSPQPRSDTATRPADAPALATAPRRDGEVVLRGELSPATHGPLDLTGRYRVRFVQHAPEDPRLDFAAQTAFVAALRPAQQPQAAAISLFRKAARHGERRVTLDGRYVVEVSFGDYPYVIRFTPDRGRR